jgi:hypothetical protein
MEVYRDRPSTAFPIAPLLDAAPAPTNNAPLDVATEAAVKQDVLSTLLENSQSAAPPKSWPFIAATDEIRQLTLGPYAAGEHGLGVELKRRFTEEQIAAANRIPGEPLLKRLSRLFIGVDRKFIVIGGAAGCGPTICTESGNLWSQEPPALTPALSRVDATSNTRMVPLFLSEAVDDVQVLRGLGLNAELSIGLQRLTAAAIERLFAQVSPDECWRYRLIIVDWNVCSVNCDDRPRARPVLQRLALTQKTYDRDPGIRFSRWRPEKNTRAAIRNARDFQDAQRVHDLIQTSLPKEQLGATWNYHIKPVPITYNVARTKLQNLLTRSTEFPLVADIKTALQEFRNVSQSDVTARLYAMADCEESPVKRAMVHQAAEVHERWFEMQPIVQAALKVIAGNHPGTNWQFNTDDLKERMALSDRLFAMFNKLQK